MNAVHGFRVVVDLPGRGGVVKTYWKLIGNEREGACPYHCSKVWKESSV